MTCSGRTDTIAAVATGTGTGGIAIVRVSGPDAEKILTAVTGREKFRDRCLTYAHVRSESGEILDEVMAVLMRAPKTYTREDVAEIDCHGGYEAASRVLARVLAAGARPAMGGEFTRRAFENGRIDLSEAEAVMRLIGAKSESEARSAVRQLKGGVSDFVGRVSETLLGVLSGIEAATDFPDEISEEEAAGDILPRLSDVSELLRQHTRPLSARILREGASIVLAGRPNAGKSSLMNRLLERERAIVTAIPGTTRDVISEEIELEGIRACLSDTAGIRAGENEAEEIGIDRARDAVSSADIVLVVLDSSREITPEDREILSLAGERAIPVGNKCDIARGACPVPGSVSISCLTGEGIAHLREEIAQRLKNAVYADQCLVLARHLECAKIALEAVERARKAILGGLALDAVTLDVKDALDALYAITGQSATEDVIDRVFRDFCVGK